MNDLEIRQNFHRKKLRRQHAQKDTLVIDELGLNHGKCRADIAVVNGHLIGYEIKSNKDSLRRLKEQVKSYNAVFDKISIVVGDRYINSIQSHIPECWGVILCARGPRGAVNFDTIREAQTNENIDPISVAQLLWRNEAEEILRQKKLSSKILRQPRAILYEYIVDTLSICELRKFVRKYFKKRKNWRCPGLPSQYDDLCRPVAMS
ncbi:MAG TPA: sce7726 family protein [Sedimentisphaerales bacterium]|nr:sce7726 family protein [Sedimentisphaerales bacterium]